jgi:catechol 2,3-dioxygenase-like lactoylglutathione lyase family enzyme
MQQIITGIQQVGIGVSNAEEAFEWYRKAFGADIPVFDDVAEAKLMTRYTGDTVQKRRAILALNIMGGGGFEIWQFKSRKPQAPAFQTQLGDLGINAVKIKSPDVKKAHSKLKDFAGDKVSAIMKAPDKTLHFWVEDPYGNLFQVVEGNSWFGSAKSVTGGVSGVIIGVSDIEKAMSLYTDVLGFENVAYDQEGLFDDLQHDGKFRRVNLQKNQKDEGPFSRLFGHIDVELVQVLDREPKKLFEGRYWGDLGFIHVCFDVNDMERLKTTCNADGYEFTVDSAESFDMGEAAGRFSYIEDPDGTLVEFVQTHKVPIMKKWGWYINLKNRKTSDPLPNWMLKSMSMNRVKG